jgi:DNA glycosylase AlkZ-like
MADVLTRRELNRATLARQMLLARQHATVPQTVERLLAMQAQEARPPFVGLWSRLADFSAEQLHAALHDREVVRATYMRATLHLLSARDYLTFRLAIQPMLTAAVDSVVKRTGGAPLDQELLLPAARSILSARPRDFAAIRELLQERFPDANDRALGYAVRMSLPLVMVPTKDRWAFPSVADFTLADTWLGSPPSPAESLEPLVRRYLAAFGPATPADMQTWSGMPRMRPVFEKLRPRLRVWRDERGQELFDVPDLPRPEPDAVAHVRFLPDFDSLLLAHADRSRVVPDEHRPRLVTKNLRIPASFLCDGFVGGTWKVTRRSKTATMTVTPFEVLPKQAVADLAEEGHRLLGFAEPEAEKLDVRFTSPE